MRKMFLGISGALLYMEVVYHFASFGLKGINPVLLLPLIVFVAGVESLVAGLFRKKVKMILTWVFMGINYFIYASQLVYLSIFQQPMLMDAVLNAGQAALTDFGKEAFHGILGCTVSLILLAVPFIVLFFLQKKGLVVYDIYKKRHWKQTIITAVAGLLVFCMVLLFGYLFKWNLYEEYQGFYDPSKVVSAYGVLPMVERDLFGDGLPAASSALEAAAESELIDSETADEDGVDTSPNVLEIDFDKLESLAETDLAKQLAQYMENMTPTRKNEYTGMFEGYNLIYLTAEGFSQYAVDEELTPTLYKLTHSGFVIDDYYVPLWQTSTSDGEYVNMTGMIPDQQFSMRRTKDNAQPFSLASYFNREGVTSYAYHNNSLTYYDRYLTHPNMGYIFKAAKLGTLTQEEGGANLFSMEGMDYWPTSDLEMMKATIPEYINDDRFHVYYMTISGHMEYTFDDNAMSELHREDVASLPYSDEGRAYIACNMELDLALEYLIEELDKAGKLENTVIALSADHYPYGLETDKLEELAGTELDGTLDLYRNSLILWNSEMETIQIEKTCSSIDLLPTLLNLFGFDYDSRLYAGNDMLSDSESLVVFADRSFITDKVEYNKETGKAVSRTGEEVDEAYLDQMKTKVKGLFEYSAGILNEDFYKYVEQALKEPLPEDQTVIQAVIIEEEEIIEDNTEKSTVSDSAENPD